jgi:transposase-like protein
LKSKNKRRRPYSSERKQAALETLKRNEGNFYQTAKETGISDATLYRWLRLEQVGEAVDHAPLDERFEQVAHQLVAAMTEKLDEANLHQITEALKFVFDKIGQTEEDDGSDVYEKLADLLNRRAAALGAADDPEPVDGSAG